MTAHVLLNPTARGGRNRALQRPLERALAGAGLDATVTVTSIRGDAERLARRWGEAGALVVVAGGDGTVHEAVNGLDGTDGTLGVLTLGTGNDYAHALGMPDGLDAAAQALATAPLQRVDLGRVRWTDVRGESHQRVFANAVGMGFDAHAAALAAETKWLGGRAAYLAAVLRTLWVWRRPGIRVAVRARQLAASGDGGETDGLDYDGPIFLCEVGNGHSVGGGFLITPDARLDDGLLDVCLVRHLAPRRALQLLPQTFTGSHTSAPEVRMARTRSLVLSVDPGSVWPGIGLHADGETLTYDAVEVEVEIDAAALSVRAPHVGPR